MNSMNRMMIFILLLALLYALYRYQQQILSTPEKIESRKSNLKKVKFVSHSHSDDNVSIDNISQYSMDSKEELGSQKSEESQFSNESYDNKSNESLSFLAEDKKRKNVRENF